MNRPMEQGYAGQVVQCRCSHCGEMYASNYIHTCDPPLEMGGGSPSFHIGDRTLPRTSAPLRRPADSAR